MRDAHSRLLERVLSQLKGVRREGNHHKACCPAHTDSTPSLSVRLGDRGVLLRCFAGCTHQDVVAALGMRVEELFFDYDPERKFERPVEQADPTHELGLTLAAFAEHKGLDPELCDRLGLRDAMIAGRRVVTFAYPLRDGTSARLRIRATLTGEKRFRWEGGDIEVAAYEPDLGALARARKYVCIVEGESDALTLLTHGIPAIGLPGADTARLLQPHHVEGVERAFVFREPDKGGDSFARNVPAALERIGFTGKMPVVRMPEGTKDASALYLSNREGFVRALEKLLEKADPPRSKSLEVLFSMQAVERAELRSGFAQLDRAFDDGGLPLGKLCVLVGGPGSRKTGLGVHFADVFSRQGAAVMFMCADEDRHNIVSRLGQRMGFHRRGLRDMDEIGDATRAEAGRQEAALDRILHLAELGDPEDAQTIEDAYTELMSIGKGRPRVLIVDSLQACRSEAAEALDRPDPRVAVDAKVRALRLIKQTGVLVIVISETRRSFYGGGKPITKDDVLSAAKESGGVEFGADLIAGMVRDKVDENLVELLVAKCRFGQEARFSLRWDRRYATLTELEPEAEARARQDREDKTSHDERRESLREAVYELVERRPGLTRTQLRAVLKKGRVAVNEAIDELSAEGRIVEQKNGNGARSPIYTQDALLRQERGE
jgi:KaiC/GvpD/RAD55 family RecA-like ATPase/biotin operon repressor